MLTRYWDARKRPPLLDIRDTFFRIFQRYARKA
jgi:hypothetical protein